MPPQTFAQFLANRQQQAAMPVTPQQAMMNSAIANQIQQSIAVNQARQLPPPPMPVPVPQAAYNGGGSGVMANDIMGQYGPIVTSPQYRTAPPTNNASPAAMPVTPQDAQAKMQARIAFGMQVAKGLSNGPELGVGNPPIQPPNTGTPPVADPNAVFPGLSGRGTRGTEWSGMDLYNQIVDTGVPTGTAMGLANAVVTAPDPPRLDAAYRAIDAAVKAAPDYGKDPVGQAINTASGPVGKTVAVANEAVNWGRIQFENAQADALANAFIDGRKHGRSDRETIDLFKSPANPLTWNVPIGPNDDDATITRFADGLIAAYTKGYTAYGAPEPGVGQPLAASQRPIVAQFGPGSQAAHEYLAGQGSWVERAAGDLLLDPTNYAIPAAAGVGESIAEYGTNLAARGAAEEGAGAVAKQGAGKVITVGGQVMRVPDVVLNAAADHAINTVASVGRQAVDTIPLVGEQLGRAIDATMATPKRVASKIKGQDSYDSLGNADLAEANATQDIGTQDIGTAVQPPPGPTAPGEPVPVPGGAPAPSGPQYPDLFPPGARSEIGMTPEERAAAVATGDTNVFDPTVGGGRIVDEATAMQQAPTIDRAEKAAAFEAANAPKRDAAWARDRELETQIKDKQREAEAFKAQRDQLPQGPERETAHTAAQDAYAEADALKVDQKVNAVEHTVNDVVGDYTQHVGPVGEVPVTAKRLDLTRPAKVGDEWLADGGRSPYGNAIKAGKDPVGGGTRYTISGTDEEKAIVTKGDDGKWTVRTNKAAGNKLVGVGMTDEEAIRAADAAITPAKPNFKDESTAYLIERAVYKDDTGALNVLKERITPEQYDRIAKAQTNMRVYQTIRPMDPSIGAFTVKATAERSEVGDKYLAGLEQKGWTKTDLPNGDVRYQRTGRTARETPAPTPEPPVAAPPIVPDEVTARAKQDILDAVQQKQEFNKQFAAQAGKTSAYRGPELGLFKKVAQDANSLDEAMAILDDYGKTHYGPRENATRLSQRQVYGKDLPPERQSEIYIGDRRGRGWKFVDNVKGTVQQFWEDSQKLNAVDPRIRHMISLDETPLPEVSQDLTKRGEMPPPAPEPFVDTSRLLAPQDRQLVDVERFTGAAEPLLKGKTLRQVRDSIEPTVVAKQARAQVLTREIAENKVALGLDPNTPLDVPTRKGVGRPVVETTGEGPFFKTNRPAGSVSSTDIIAKEKELGNLQAEFGKYTKGTDFATADARDIANQSAAYQRELDLNPALAKKPNLALDLIDALVFRLPRHLLLADPLTSWGYTERNILGNIETAGLGTSGRSGQRLVDSITAGFRDKTPFGEQISDDLGLSRPSQYTRDVSNLDITPKGANTPTRDLLGKKLKLDPIARAFDWKRGVDGAFEYSAKITTYGIVLQDKAAEAMARLADEMTAYARIRGVDFGQTGIIDRMYAIRTPETEVFTAKALREEMEATGKAAGMDDVAAKRFADTAAQKWTYAARQAQEDAIATTNRIFPSIRRMTNLDRYVSYLSLFHFWPTRTARLVLEEMIRHPQLIHIWSEAHQGLARMAEEGNYPESVKGLMHIAESPFGYAMYANPASLFLITALQPDTATVQDPEHVTAVGKALQDFKDKTGLGPSPFVDTLLNVLGVYGNAMPPQPWPSRTEVLALAAVNYGRAMMGMAPLHDPLQEGGVWVRSKVSGKLWGTSNIPATDTNAYTMDIVGSVVLDNNPSLAQRMAQVGPDGKLTADAIAAQSQFGDIMNDPENPEYQAALKQASAQNLFTNVLNAFSPLTMRAKLLSRESTLDAAKAGRASTDPTPMQQGAIQVRSALTQTPEANQLDAEVGAYHLIGTDRQQQLGDGWQTIAYAQFDPTQTVTVRGRTYSKSELTAMSQTQRYNLADAWVAEVGGTQEYADYKASQKSFKATHPTYAGYASYVDSISKSPLGEDVWIATTREGNKNFDAYLTEQEQKYGTAPADAIFSPKAYFAYKGQKWSLYDANAQSVRDTSGIPFNANETVGGTAASSSGTGGAKDTSVAGRAQTLSDAVDKYNTDLALLQPYLPADWAGMSPAMRNAYSDSLYRQTGQTIPSMPGIVESYYKWVATRKSGEATSYTDYITWLDTQKAAMDAALAPAA